MVIRMTAQVEVHTFVSMRRIIHFKQILIVQKKGGEVRTNYEKKIIFKCRTKTFLMNGKKRVTTGLDGLEQWTGKEKVPKQQFCVT